MWRRSIAWPGAGRAADGEVNENRPERFGDGQKILGANKGQAPGEKRVD
jgi:hypothetical protein